MHARAAKTQNDSLRCTLHMRLYQLHTQCQIFGTVVFATIMNQLSMVLDNLTCVEQVCLYIDRYRSI